MARMVAPGAGDTARGGKSAPLASERAQNTPPVGGNKLIVRVVPTGPTMTLSGREAQTIKLLIERGARGFTSGEALSLGWARRTSHYVWKLRRRGVPIITTREITADARLGRYSLGGRVHVVQA